VLISTLTAKDIPIASGIYNFLDEAKSVLYVGKAVNLRVRLTNYLRKVNLDGKTVLMLSRAKEVSWVETNSEFEALTLEAHLIKAYKPRFNIIWKDDKSYIYMHISKDEFPQISLMRKQDIKDGISFGPFPSKRIIAEMLRDVRRIIPYCAQSRRVKRACFYTHLGLCAPCPSHIKSLTGQKYLEQKRIYRNNISQIKALFAGRFSPVEKYLTSRMKEASLAANYEEAAHFRDKLNLLKNLTTRHFAATAYIENPMLAKDTSQKALRALQKTLLPYYPALDFLQRIECYDISHISGKLATGSMVVFINGACDKRFYRRFRIKGISKNDDFACLRQVLARRLRHTEWELPQLIIIDGGAPQLRAVAQVFLERNPSIAYIGLAKQFEEVVVPYQGAFPKIRLPKGDALHLLQKIRDEAHRFAHSYHTVLRLKALI